MSIRAATTSTYDAPLPQHVTTDSEEENIFRKHKVAVAALVAFGSLCLAYQGMSFYDNSTAPKGSSSSSPPTQDLSLDKIEADILENLHSLFETGAEVATQIHSAGESALASAQAAATALGDNLTPIRDLLQARFGNEFEQVANYTSEHLDAVKQTVQTFRQENQDDPVIQFLEVVASTTSGAYNLTTTVILPVAWNITKGSATTLTEMARKALKPSAKQAKKIERNKQKKAAKRAQQSMRKAAQFIQSQAGACMPTSRKGKRPLSFS